MRRQARFFPGITLLLLVACGGPADEGSEFATDAEEATAATVQIVTDGAAPSEFVRLVSGAKRSVDVVAFEYVFTGVAVRPINEALRAAVQRGVKVRVLVDDGVPASLLALPGLRAFGVDARADTGVMKTHNKLVIVDGTAFLAGSTNLSPTSLTRNHETNVIVRIAAPAAALQAYFNRIWVAPAQPATVPATGQGRVVQVLGDGQYAAAAKAAIGAARSHVELVMYQGGYSPIARPDNVRNGLVDALGAAAGRGIHVRVVLDRGADGLPSGDNAAFAQRLLASGVEVRFDPASITTHAKLLVADDVAITGSTNWTASALSDYHATDILVRRAAVAAGFRAYFETVWSAATP